MALCTFLRVVLHLLREALLWVPYLEIVLHKLVGNRYTRWLRPQEFWAELRDYDKQLFFQAFDNRTWLDRLLT